MTHDPNKRRQVDGMIRDGFSIAQAAKKAHVGRSYVEGRRRVLRAELEEMKAANERKIGGPVPHDSLSPVAADCLEDFGRYRARYFGRVSTPWQEQAGVKVAELLATENEEYLVVNCPPASGKSTLFTHDIPAWLTCRDRSMRGLMGSYGERVAAAYTARLRMTLTRKSPMQAKRHELARGMALDAEAALAQDYGSFKPEIQEIWRREQFTVSQLGETSTDEKESTWTAFGKDSGSLGWRANFVNWDDLFTVRMRTAEVIEDLKEWWDSEAQERVEPGGLLVLQGQRLRSDDIYRYALDKTLWTAELDLGDDSAPRKYHHVVYKAHYDELCQAETDPDCHKQSAVPYNPYDPPSGGCLLDPKRVSWQKIRGAIAQGNFQTVFQQEDSDPARALVRRIWIDGGLEDGVDRPGCWDRDRATGELPRLARAARPVRYITVDPSPTKFWSVQDWVYAHVQDDSEPLAGTRFLVDVVRARMGANELLDWSNDQQSWTGLLDEWVLRAKDQAFPIGYIIMEKNAAQRWAMQYEHFHRWRAARGVQIIPHETMRNKTDPTLGIEATLPGVYMLGRVRLPARGPHRQHVDNLVTEVTKWPDWSTDDGVLAQWFGEYNLPNINTARYQSGTMFKDMPSWIRKTPVGARR